jgi:hypothetical protein
MRFLFAKIYNLLVVWKKISGALASSMFVYAFNKCSGLTGGFAKDKWAISV